MISLDLTTKTNEETTIETTNAIMVVAEGPIIVVRATDKTVNVRPTQASNLMHWPITAKAHRASQTISNANVDTTTITETEVTATAVSTAITDDAMVTITTVRSRTMPTMIGQMLNQNQAMTKYRNKFFSATIVIVALLFAACNNRDVYNSYISMPDNGWNSDSLAVFRADIDNDELPYNLWIQVRNESNYQYANLWLFVNIVSPNGTVSTDTLECVLAEPNGKWLGSGWGSLYTIQCPYRMGAKFASTGQYTFRIQHGMRQSGIEGIKSIGLRIETAEKQ